MNLIGKPLPHFSLHGYCNGKEMTFNTNDCKGRTTVLFFYPLDFTFVCPTELLALDAAHTEFEKRNAAVFGVSVDSIHSHRAWCETARAKGGLETISYPLLSDLHRQCAQALGVLDEEEGIALRATVIIDADGIVQHVSVNNLSYGRNVKEILRLIDAITYVQKHGDQVCPANWTDGDEAIAPNPESTAAYISKK
jgi:peroxiredoxin (alkyl hydroperoxide reductase subunit C)